MHRWDASRPRSSRLGAVLWVLFAKRSSTAPAAAPSVEWTHRPSDASAAAWTPMAVKQSHIIRHNTISIHMHPKMNLEDPQASIPWKSPGPDHHKISVVRAFSCLDHRENSTEKFKKTRNMFCGTWYLPHSRVHKSILNCAHSNRIPYPHFCWCCDVHVLLKNIKWILKSH